MIKSRFLSAFLACALALATAGQALAGSVTADVAARVAGTYAGTNGLGSVSFGLNLNALTQLSPGTALGKADLLFSDQRTLAASANENLDLAGVLFDPFGALLTFGHVKAIYIHASATNTNSVVVGAGTNPFLGPFGGTTPTISIPPGGVALLVHPGAGWIVTPATGDILKVANSGAGTGITYDVVLIGTST